jgi:lysine/ornithine N-monooxygenase
MPSFAADDVVVFVEDFVDSCSDTDIDDLIDYLHKEGHLKKFIVAQTLHAAEDEYEEALNKLHNKWNRLPIDESDTIIKIAKSF